MIDKFTMKDGTLHRNDYPVFCPWMMGRMELIGQLPLLGSRNNQTQMAMGQSSKGCGTWCAVFRQQEAFIIQGCISHSEAHTDTIILETPTPKESPLGKEQEGGNTRHEAH